MKSLQAFRLIKRNTIVVANHKPTSPPFLSLPVSKFSDLSRFFSEICRSLILCCRLQIFLQEIPEKSPNSNLASSRKHFGRHAMSMSPVALQNMTSSDKKLLQILRFPITLLQFPLLFLIVYEATEIFGPFPSLFQDFQFIEVLFYHLFKHCLSDIPR